MSIIFTTFADKKFPVMSLSYTYVSSKGDLLFHKVRWSATNGRVVCPYCGHTHVYTCRGKYSYKCPHCNNRFTDKTRSFLHNSKLPVTTWVKALYLMVTLPTISSIRLGRYLSVTHKTAWSMMSRIRLALSQKSIVMENDSLSMDEVYYGGNFSRMHYGKKLEILSRYGYTDRDNKPDKSCLLAAISDYKSHVYGLTDGERLVLCDLPNPITQHNIVMCYKSHTREDKVYTAVSDKSRLYNRWKFLTGDNLLINNHSRNQYRVNGKSSNSIEGAFSHLKRNLVSGYVRPSKRLLQGYLNEFVWRWNVRDKSTREKLETWLSVMMYERVTERDVREFDPYTGYEKRETDMDRVRNVLSSSMVTCVEVGKHRYYRSNLGVDKCTNAKIIEESDSKLS